MAKFIAHPPTAIQAMYQYVRRTPEHRNVLIPNKRENIVKVRSNGDWVLRDRKNFITPLVHAIADRISLAAERDDVTTLLGSEVVERWVRHHENVCNHARVLADTVNQVELVILSERMNS